MTRGKVPVSPSKLRGRCQIDDREHAQTRRTARSMTEHRASMSPRQSTRADTPRTIHAGNVCKVGRIRLIARSPSLMDFLTLSPVWIQKSNPTSTIVSCS